jgi:TolB-like protein
MSGDPDQDYFVDGMVEDIITALSRFNQLFVIARNSTFTYKGRAVDVKQVGGDLGVRYVLEGSLRKAGNRVRITGQLIDASTGSHLWADRFDGELTDVFELQDRVTGKVVGAIAPKLEQAEIERAKLKPTERLDAYDCYLRGMATFHLFTITSNKDALSLFTRAIELDPEFGAAYGMAARCYAQRKGFGWTTHSESDGLEASRLARKAADLGRNDAVALSAAGFSLVLFGSIADGTALIDRALALNPNLVWAWNASAMARVFAGEGDAAVEHCEHAMRLNPLDPAKFGMHALAGAGHFLCCRYDKAYACAVAALHERPNFHFAAGLAAASAALAGKDADAAVAIGRLREINPMLSLSNLSDWMPFQRSEDLALWSHGLRAAGLPEAR